ncbi:MAG: glutathione S-transferase family protein [Sphingomonadales bacterium]|nr:glutathione S-transferase family protein [Sphingomonadales bacterium]
MDTLYHMWLVPGCRKVRLVLGEKGIEVNLKSELYWERREEFLRLNPAGDVPVLVEKESGAVMADATAIAEYLDESHPEPPLMGATLLEGAEIRRLVAWFDKKFEKEVTSLLTSEKVMKRFLKMGEPSSKNIRCALQNLKSHMAYISYLAERRNYLAGNRISLADLTAAAHISVVDYLGDINWEQWPEAKNWYVRVKSRPSFRPLLADRIGGLTPPLHYSKLDF